MMNNEKWYIKIFKYIIIVIFAPLILLFFLAAGIIYLFQTPSAKKEYKYSPYFSNFQRKFSWVIYNSPEYRFFNSAVRRELPIDYHRQESNGLEYFVFNETLFLFPDFDQIIKEDGNEKWIVHIDDTYIDLDQHIASLVSQLDTNHSYPVKVLVERAMISESNPEKSLLPDSLFLIGSYEQAFNEEDLRIRMVVPQNTLELYQLISQETDLSGVFELSDDNETIHWFIDNIRLELSVGKRDCYIGANKPGNVITEKSITHWHPEREEVFPEVCKIGKPGSILVLRSFFGGGAVMYCGPKSECPCFPPKRHWFSKYYYIEPN